MASAATAMLVSRATCSDDAATELALRTSEVDAATGAALTRLSAEDEASVAESVGAGAIGVRVSGTAVPKPE